MPVAAEPRLRVVLEQIIQETPQIRTLRFKRKDGGKFEFKPGQFFLLSFPEDPVNKRSYSVSSSPLQTDHVDFTLEVAGKFTMRLFKLKAPCEMQLRGPLGKFIYDPQTAPEAVLIASGAGVAPYRAMVHLVTDQNLANRITLAQSARTAEELVFRSEFEKLAAAHPNFLYHASVTRPQESKVPWAGPTGRLSVETLRRIVPDFASARFYLCGSRSLIDGMAAELENAGVDKDRIVYEKWW